MSTHQNGQAKAIASSFFLAAFMASSGQGYAIAQPATKPSTKAFTFPTRDTIVPPQENKRIPSTDVTTAFLRSENKPFSIEQPRKPSRSSYSLGLGKNKPVVQNSSTTSTESTDELDLLNMAEAVIHWNEYESAREFPSPLNKAEVQYERNAPAKPTRKVVPINPTRFVEDSLPIVHRVPQRSNPSTVSRNAPPVMMMRAGSSQLDVNTAWVEMLIHSEQQKFASLAAN